jgi:small subunit ribosomal protein S4e
MGRKGNHRHLAGLATPDFYNVHRKEFEYVTKSGAGRHTSEKSIPLILAIKKAGLASTKRDAVRVLNETTVLVNGRRIREMKYPVGLNDIIEFKDAGRSIAVGINANGQCTLDDTKTDRSNMHIKVIGKYKAAKGAIMLRLHDGSIIKGDNTTKVNDSVVITDDRTLKKTIPMKEGAKCLIINGVHLGSGGTLKKIKAGTMKIPATVIVQPENGEEFETMIKNILVTG